MAFLGDCLKTYIKCVIGNAVATFLLLACVVVVIATIQFAILISKLH